MGVPGPTGNTGLKTRYYRTSPVPKRYYRSSENPVLPLQKPVLPPGTEQKKQIPRFQPLTVLSITFAFELGFWCSLARFEEEKELYIIIHVVHAIYSIQIP